MSLWSEKREGPMRSRLSRRFIARQPILDKRSVTVGYELLFRAGWENRFSGDGEVASQTLVDYALSFGLDSLVGDTIPFLNCTREVLLQGLPTLLPSNCVLEVLENVDVDQELISACHHLHGLGYRIALDDFDFSSRWEPLLPLADIIKVDFLAFSAQERRSMLRHLHPAPAQLLAEKVETGAEFRLALNEGFDLFQGYFFTRPVVLSRPAMPSIISKLRLLNELNERDLNYDRMIVLLKEETAVSFRLLRCANSALFGRREPVTDLHKALILVGENEFRKLARTALSTEICGRQPLETHRTILQTARFCELMAVAVDHNAEELYVFGMLSVIQSVLGLEAQALCEIVGLRGELMDALSGAENLFSKLLLCSRGLRAGDWADFKCTAASLGHNDDDVYETITLAREWADDVLRAA